MRTGDPGRCGILLQLRGAEEDRDGDRRYGRTRQREERGMSSLRIREQGGRRILRILRKADSPHDDRTGHDPAQAHHEGQDSHRSRSRPRDIQRVRARTSGHEEVLPGVPLHGDLGDMDLPVPLLHQDDGFHVLPVADVRVLHILQAEHGGHRIGLLQRAR